MKRAHALPLPLLFALALVLSLPIARPTVTYAEGQDDGVALEGVEAEGADANLEVEAFDAEDAESPEAVQPEAEVPEVVAPEAADPEATDSAEPTDEGFELDPAAPPSSDTCGTVDWSIDSSGVLKLGAGTLGDWGDASPWTGRTDIKSVYCDGTVKATTCKNMFKDCTNLATVIFDSFDNTSATSCVGMFENNYSLRNLSTGSLYDFKPAGAIPDNPWAGKPQWGYCIEEGETFKWQKWMEGDEIKSTLSLKGAILLSQANVADKDAVTIQPIPDQKYTGSPITPKLTITSGSYELGESMDYDVTFKDNVNAGTATVTVTGKYLYTGVTEVTFKITTASVAKFLRVSGATALDTAAAATKADGVFADGRGKGVVVATSDGYWDALAASAFAGSLVDGAPVLITPKDSLAPQTKAELERLKPEWIFVMGGKAAISESTFDEIAKYAPGKTERIAGKTAADTAVEIYHKPPTWKSDTAVIATSNGYWDALSIAPYAYHAGAPIFLTTYNDTVGGQILGDNAYGSLDAAKMGDTFKRIVIVGGKAAISGAVEEQLLEMGYTTSQIVRLAGATALDTSAEIAKWELGEGMGLSRMGIATNNGYWDALTGAALCGQQNSVLVLVAKTGGYTAFDAVYDSAKVTGGYVFGGKAAVSDASFEYFNTK